MSLLLNRFYFGNPANAGNVLSPDEAHQLIK